MDNFRSKMNDSFQAPTFSGYEPQFTVPDPNGLRHDESMRAAREQARLTEEARDLSQEVRDLAKQSAEQTARQTALLSEIRRMDEVLASERRVTSTREKIQQAQNKRMTWFALILALGAFFAPFIVLAIDLSLRP